MSSPTPAGEHWRVEMRDGDRWIPVGTPCVTRPEAVYQLALRGGTGLTYRIAHHAADASPGGRAGS